jgi:hypothetical protein
MAEIKRPTKVIGILPNEDAITHLVGRRRPLTLTSSANDEKFIWSVSGCDGARLTGWRGRSHPGYKHKKHLIISGPAIVIHVRHSIYS